MLQLRIAAEPRDIHIIQVYMPTSAEKDEVVDEVYEQLEELVNGCNSKDQIIVMGDWNAVVGEARDGKEVGEEKGMKEERS